MAESAVSAGQVLVGRYRLEVQLGSGGMGTIWRAQHLVLNAPVAVKVIDRTVIPDEETLSRFMREAQSAAALRSPHVVQILDYGSDGKVPFIAMELLEGENLAQRLKRERRLSAAETARFVAHIGRAISRAHEAGIVHRDLKPDNVFIVRNEDEEIAKVLDFGVAKVSSTALEGTRTRTGSILGTPFYMSPEQAQGNRAVDARSDLWSMAVIAFECMTGSRPFYSEGLGDLVLAICVRDIPLPSSVAEVPPGFDDWWKRAVARDPEQRFQSAKDLVDSLREALGLEPRELAREAFSTTSVVAPPAREAPSSSPNSSPFSSSVTVELADPTADGHAPTLNLHSTGEVPALTERQFGTTQRSSPATSASRGGMGLVLGVAATALFVGLLGGLFVLRRGEATAADPDRPLPAPTPERQLEPERKQRPRVLPAASESAATTATSAAASASASGSAPTAVGSAPPAESARPALKPPASASASSAPPQSAETPDAGWVKPDWAVPDEEPLRRPPVTE